MTSSTPAVRSYPRRRALSWLAGTDMPEDLSWQETCPFSAAHANSVAGGLGAGPGQRPLSAEQDLREALGGFRACPVALQLAAHLDHAGRLAAGLGDAVQPGLVRLW